MISEPRHYLLIAWELAGESRILILGLLVAVIGFGAREFSLDIAVKEEHGLVDAVNSAPALKIWNAGA